MHIGRASSRFYKATSQHSYRYGTRRTFKVGLQRKAENVSTEVSRTRNIGIIAHIDAVSQKWACPLTADLIKSKGKTTTTERMLYYSGHTRRIGSMSLFWLPFQSSVFLANHCYLFQLQDVCQTLYLFTQGVDLPNVSFLPIPQM